MYDNLLSYRNKIEVLELFDILGIQQAINILMIQNIENEQNIHKLFLNHLAVRKMIGKKKKIIK